MQQKPIWKSRYLYPKKNQTTIRFCVWCKKKTLSRCIEMYFIWKDQTGRKNFFDCFFPQNRWFVKEAWLTVLLLFTNWRKSFVLSYGLEYHSIPLWAGEIDRLECVAFPYHLATYQRSRASLWSGLGLLITSNLISYHGVQLYGFCATTLACLPARWLGQDLGPAMVKREALFH